VGHRGADLDPGVSTRAVAIGLALVPALVVAAADERRRTVRRVPTGDRLRSFARCGPQGLPPVWRGARRSAVGPADHHTALAVGTVARGLADVHAVAEGAHQVGCAFAVVVTGRDHGLGRLAAAAE
jgi:hypothetical protein